ncbi:sterile alpha motif domain-containing protein 15 [Dipodomys spectabilis]|uniref:sterile alpha motif domain-containing protein 15 n=1 Tax=Dipodomys spectabilis TaxID=105255 RepID=UPI001C53B5D1|nr:sterile alpha motif domain-containing protein 15 [Dipodomys spectabilis]
MSADPEDYDFSLDEDEYTLFERFKRPRLSGTYEVVEIDVAGRAGPQPSSEIGQEPESAEAGEEDVPQEPTGTAQEDPHSKRDLSSPTKPGSSQGLKSETSRLGYDERYENPRYENDETYENEMYETYIDPLAEVNQALTYYELTESATEIIGPEAPIGESRLEIPEETEQEVPEKLFEEQYEDIGLEPSGQITPVITPSEKSVEEKVQPGKMTEKEITEDTRKDSIEKKSMELSEQSKPEFSDQRPRKSTEEADPGSLEEIKARVPDEKPGDSTKEEVPESLEESKPEFSGEKSRKSIDKTSPEPSEIPKETRRKSYKEKVTGPPEEAGVTVPQEMEPEKGQRKSLEDTKPIDQKQKQRKSSEETEQATLEKSETLKESTEEKGEELPEQTKSEFPEEDSGKSPDKTDQIPPQSPKLEVKGEIEVEKNLKLSGKDKTREKHAESSEEISSKQIKSDGSVDNDERAHPEYQTRKLSKKETDTARDSEVELVSMDDSVSSPELQKLLSFISTEYFHLRSMSQDEGTSSSSEFDPSQELAELFNKRYQFQYIKDFEYLTWSPEKVADWISYLGFPQYKECFTTNFISGRKLIHVNCSNLPQIGITDFEDMKLISHHVRELLRIEEPLFCRSIRLPYRDNIGLFLEQKSHTGVKSDSLTFTEFVKAAGLQDCDPKTTGPEEKK